MNIDNLKERIRVYTKHKQVGSSEKKKLGSMLNEIVDNQVNLDIEPEQVKYLPQKFVEIICNEIGVNLFQQEIDKVIFSYVPEENRNDTATLKDLIKLKTGLIDRNIETLKQ